MPSIAARPFAFEYEPESIGLVVIDMQRDFLEPGGFGAALGNDVSLLAETIEPTAKLLALFRERGWPVIHTREAHKPDLSDCPPAKRLRGDGDFLRIGDEGPMGRILISGEPGVEIVPALFPLEGETVLDKPGKGAFWATPIHEILKEKKLKQLVFAGVTTEVCVQTTMREANDRGYQCLLIEEATGSYFPEFKSATIDMITAQNGIVGWAATLADFEKGLG